MVPAMNIMQASAISSLVACHIAWVTRRNNQFRYRWEIAISDSGDGLHAPVEGHQIITCRRVTLDRSSTRPLWNQQHLGARKPMGTCPLCASASYSATRSSHTTLVSFLHLLAAQLPSERRSNCATPIHRQAAMCPTKKTIETNCRTDTRPSSLQQPHCTLTSRAAEPHSVEVSETATTQQPRHRCSQKCELFCYRPIARSSGTPVVVGTACAHHKHSASACKQPHSRLQTESRGCSA
jgi:hypothetical protein